MPWVVPDILEFGMIMAAMFFGLGVMVLLGRWWER
jgi:hypothetical protein